MKINLSRRPRLIEAGFGSHGHLRVERFRATYPVITFVRYRGHLQFADQSFPFHFGCALLTPPDADLVFTFGEPECRHIFVLFQSSGNESGMVFPHLIDCGTVYSRIDALLQDVVHYRALNPLRAEVCLWQALWVLDDCRRVAAATPAELAVREAVAYLEQNLDQPLQARDVARAVRFSHNHLNRLFRQTLDCTIKEYLQRRRMERAASLLRSTDKLIKQVAVECGIPDVQYFNKTVRRHFGQSPSAVRQGRSGDCP